MPHYSYSALKMDGKPLYDYARSNTPLPRPIEARDVTIYDLQLLKWQEATEHSWSPPAAELSEEEKSNLWIGTAGDELSMMDFNGLCYKNKQEWLEGMRSPK